MFQPLVMASGSSSPSSNCSYDVFPSFSGEDVRKTFLSHLLRELDGKSMVVFKDNEMERSQSISPELVKAIRGSRIAVVVFSKNYASSSWCLNELLEILKCKEEFGQMVLPIFYDLDPTHVRKQIGDFGKAFKKTCEKQKKKVIIDQWKKALTDAANLLGYHSMNWGNDAEGIENISSDISDKLYPIPSNEFENFVGIKDHIENMKSMLRLESKEVKMVGIWGTSGIGKTTIATALFGYLSRQFQNSVFIDRAFISKSKEVYGRPYLYDHNMKLSLREKFLCKMNMKGAIEKKLKHRKVLTIIDDLDDQHVLEALAGQTKWFGYGSRIIVVTTNKHLLNAHGIEDDYVYEVDLPSDGQALEIFCQAAFKQNFPPYGLEMFADEVVQRAGHLPLGLNVLGSSLRGRNKEACLNMLPRLQRNIDGKIEETLRFSYDGLGSEEDRALFRYIACYFNDVEAKDIKLFLADSELDVNIGLDNLFDKSLIHERSGKVVMHKLLEEMGRNIVRKQSIDEPGKREFLIDSKDVCNVLQKGTGTEKLLGILLKVEEIDELDVHESAFTEMHNLQFLEIRNIKTKKVEGKLKLHGRFNYLPPKLKLLIWRKYPVRCMPSHFCPESLVKLNLSDSNLEKLWEGVKDLGCLKAMYLYNSTNLKEIPDLSMAVNLEILNLRSCVSLVELPSSIRNLNKLMELNMEFCTKLEILPSGINLKSLDLLNLGSCKMLRTFPEISTKIKVLYLDSTKIDEVPRRIMEFSRLEYLNMENCSKLEYVHLNIYKLKHLKKANFSNCGALTGVDMRGYASEVVIQEDSIASSSLPDNPQVILKCRLRESIVMLDFIDCVHLNHVLLPWKHLVLSEDMEKAFVGFNSFRETYLVIKMFKLLYRIPQKNYHEVHVDVNFHATGARDIKYELRKWGIRIFKHCSSADNRLGNANTLPYACEADEDSDGCQESGYTNDNDIARETYQYEGYESSDDSDIGSEDTFITSEKQ